MAAAEAAEAEVGRDHNLRMNIRPSKNFPLKDYLPLIIVSVTALAVIAIVGIVVRF